MMDYEIFKEVVVEKLPEYLQCDLHGRAVMLHSVDKVNQTLDGLSLKLDIDKEKVSPTIYLNAAYERYKQTENLDEVLWELADAFAESMKRGAGIEKHLDFDNAKERIVFQLINLEQNKEMLRDMPYRQWKDLAIVYRLVVNMDSEGIESAIIRNSMAELLGFKEEQLFRLAVENTRVLFPPTVRSMYEIMEEMFRRDGMPEEMIEMFRNEVPEESMMYVISNDRGVNGAVSMLYEDKLHELAEEIGTDLYVLPSSIHETIAVSVEAGSPEMFANMVTEINMSQVDLSERLSNQVYHYDKDWRVLTQATDTPNKRLDGMAVAEPVLIYDTKEVSR